MMKLIAFKTLNAPAKAGGFYQLMENKMNNSQGFDLVLFFQHEKQFIVHHYHFNRNWTYAGIKAHAENHQK